MATKSSPCDLCESSDGTPIDYDPRVHVCMGCGFVYVPARRSAAEIAESWDEIYERRIYDPAWPGVRARLFYVAEWLDQKISLKGKSVLDIGAGDGFFLEQCRSRGAHPVGLDPSAANCDRIRARDIFAFHGAVEDFPNFGTHDLVTLNWTLENCGDLKTMLGFARGAMAHDGHLSVATGSRVMSGFRKPISSYFNLGIEADLHCFHWSHQTLTRAFTISELVRTAVNDYSQNDVLIVIGEHDRSEVERAPHPGNPSADVIQFFKDWQAQWP